MHAARSYETITLNRKQMASEELANGEKQLWLFLWPIFLSFLEYSFILTPASHFIMIYSGENAGGDEGGEGRGGKEATRGTVFTANDEEHTVVFRRSDICCSQTCGRLSDTESLDRKQASRETWWMLILFMYAPCVCVINRRDVLGPDVEITWLIISRISAEQSLEDGQLLQHNAPTLQWWLQPINFFSFLRRTMCVWAVHMLNYVLTYSVRCIA